MVIRTRVVPYLLTRPNKRDKDFVVPYWPCLTLLKDKDTRVPYCQTGPNKGDKDGAFAVPKIFLPFLVKI